MFTTLLCLGIIASAYAFTPGMDVRDIQLTSALFFALTLGIVEFHKEGIKPFCNKWAMLFLVYIPVSTFIAPMPSIKLVGINVSNFWSWKPTLDILTFSFMIFAIASHKFSINDIMKIVKTICWSGFCMAAYVCLQRFDMDQFFLRSVDLTHGPTASYSGFIGNPTLVAPYIAMTIPFMIFNKSYWMIPVAIAGVVFPDSIMAYAGLFGGTAFLIASKNKKYFISTIIFSVITFSLISGAYLKSPKFRENFNDHERFKIWKIIAKDIKNPIAKDINVSYPLTGRGLGSFKFVHHVEHENSFHQAHNEYLEMAYNMGVMGLFLMLASILFMFKKNFSVKKVFSGEEDILVMTLLASFITIAVVAIGTFPWQIGGSIYLTAVLVGLLHNPNFALKNRRGLA